MHNKKFSFTVGRFLMFLLPVFFLPFSLYLGSEVLSESGNENALKRELISVDKNLESAILAGNVNQVSEIYSEKFSYVHVGAAMIDTKKEALKWVKIISDNATKKSKEYNDVKILGSVGLVSGYLTVQYKGAGYPVRYHHLRVYEREGEVWRLVYQHGTFAVKSQDQVAPAIEFIFGEA